MISFINNVKNAYYTIHNIGSQLQFDSCWLLLKRFLVLVQSVHAIGTARNLLQVLVISITIVCIVLYCIGKKLQACIAVSVKNIQTCLIISWNHQPFICFSISQSPVHVSLSMLVQFVNYKIKTSSNLLPKYLKKVTAKDKVPSNFHIRNLQQKYTAIK